jgi:FdrA protein
MIDFGDDELTRGRAHPMIDGSLRAEWIVRQAERAADDGTGLVLLLDVVLGHAASPDPAGELVPALEAAQALADVAVMVSLCGTEEDPQGLAGQAERLRAAGASVHLSNAAATRKALELLADDVAGST